jgi:hypothetical protein
MNWDEIEFRLIDVNYPKPFTKSFFNVGRECPMSRLKPGQIVDIQIAGQTEEYRVMKFERGNYRGVILSYDIEKVNK